VRIPKNGTEATRGPFLRFSSRASVLLCPDCHPLRAVLLSVEMSDLQYAVFPATIATYI